MSVAFSIAAWSSNLVWKGDASANQEKFTKSTRFHSVILSGFPTASLLVSSEQDALMSSEKDVGCYFLEKKKKNKMAQSSGLSSLTGISHFPVFIARHVFAIKQSSLSGQEGFCFFTKFKSSVNSKYFSNNQGYTGFSTFRMLVKAFFQATTLPLQ